MALRETIKKQGNWLFKWRSYLPLLILPVMFLALAQTGFSKDSQFAGFWTGFTIFISFLGLIVRFLTVGFTPEGTSGRNTEEQRADTLNTSGIYSVVRHPLYLGNFLIFFGVVLYIQVWWFIIFSVIAYWIYYERIMYAEEEFLRQKFGETYLDWSNTTPAFWPRFNKWESAGLRFSFKNVLKREYSGFFGIIATFTFLRLVKPLLAQGEFNISSGWVILFIFGAIVYFALRTMKKKTSWLDVEGR